LPLFVTMVPVSSGKVSVRLVLLLGLAMVNMPLPEASGAREIFDIIYTPVSSAAIRATVLLIHPQFEPHPSVLEVWRTCHE
jgi:hypothetical protein